ncbi:MAG: hypothetical protein IJJ69_02505 [Oscillospiraceae bacterium]|nr:hypothetical protein [Oscillospiraceae bacterium]
MYENQSSLGKGIAGAVIGSLPGVFLWIILGYLGFTAAIVGFVIAFGILFGYTKFGGNMDTSAIIICTVVMLIAVYAGEHISWAMVVHSALKEYDTEITLGNCTSHLFSILDLAELKGEFIGSLVKGYLFAFLGAFGLIKKAAR